MNEVVALVELAMVLVVAQCKQASNVAVPMFSALLAPILDLTWMRRE